jgi:hypothetical protein
MQATAVCQRLLTLSQSQPRSGAVHSVFDHAVNLEVGEDGLIGLLAQEKALTPFAVTARTSTPFSTTGIRAGMAAYLQEGMLNIPDAGISLDLACAPSVDLCVDSIALGNLDLAKTQLERWILTSLGDADAENSLAPLVTGKTGNTYTRFLAPRLEQLFSAVAEDAFDKATEAAANCAGCGVGLTPSSDDLLCGYFTSLHLLFRASGNAVAKKSISGMAQAAAKRTNRISGTFLLHSGLALANAAIWDLFHNSFSNFDSIAVNNAIACVRDIGSTSGADMLTGIVLALRQHIGGNEP